MITLFKQKIKQNEFSRGKFIFNYTNKQPNPYILPVLIKIQNLERITNEQH